jgi:hypothetical protein
VNCVCDCVGSHTTAYDGSVEPVECKKMIFQLLQSIAYCHANNVSETAALVMGFVCSLFEPV